MADWQFQRLATLCASGRHSYLGEGHSGTLGSPSFLKHTVHKISVLTSALMDCAPGAAGAAGNGALAGWKTAGRVRSPLVHSCRPGPARPSGAPSRCSRGRRTCCRARRACRRSPPDAARSRCSPPACLWRDERPSTSCAAAVRRLSCARRLGCSQRARPHPGMPVPRAADHLGLPQRRTHQEEASPWRH